MKHEQNNIMEMQHIHIHKSVPFKRYDRKENATNCTERVPRCSATSHSGMPNDCASMQAVAAKLLIPKRNVRLTV